MHKHSHCRGPEKEKGSEEILEEITTENFLSMGKKKPVTQVQEAGSLRQDEPKEKYAKTHSNQTDKN